MAQLRLLRKARRVTKSSSGRPKLAGSLPNTPLIIANLSGCGDKEVEQTSKFLL